MLYRDFASQEEIDQEYNPLLTAKDAPKLMQEWANKSKKARQGANARLGMRYGPTKEEYIDLFLAESSNAPLHLFIHGGYWRKGVAEDFSFIAPQLVSSGVSVAIMNYALCPSVKIEEIVRQTRAAIYWLVTQKDRHGSPFERLTISGHSAGGHLVAMALATDWKGDYGLDNDFISGACAISGVFDLAPLPYSFLQPKLQLSLGDVESLSPIYHLPEKGPELAIVVGGGETREFIRQSRVFYDIWTARGLKGMWLEVEKVHHFNILNGLEDRNSELFKTILLAAEGTTILGR